MAAQRFRIFISSPSDVFAERERVERVITRLNGEFGGNLLEAIRWERAYYTAAKTFQDQIPLPAETDLVVCILWKRLGFELPPDYRRPDGTTPTGTEYEFENAMEAARSKGTPDVLVYRKAAPVLLDAEQVELERAQFEALKLFWTRWFRTETGHFTAAYQTFENTDQFETEVEDHIRQWLARHKVASAGVTWPIEQRGSPFRGLQPFEAGYAEVFFGRRRATERARERLADAGKRGTPFLLLLGTSGSGKSSLARAGLLPRITQPGAVPGVDVWRSCTLRPSEGDNPLHALARALYRPGALPELADGDSPAPTDFASLLASSPEAASRAIRMALTRGTAELAAREGFDRPVEARLLLLVDQFEEALVPDDVRDEFARALTALVASGLVWVVATLRSDLYALFQASAPLTALRDGGAQLDLVPPAASELGEIVTGPAAAAGLHFDKRADGTSLDEELIAAADQPGALPLLQLALDALFEARDPATNTLTFAAYDALGGLPGVVERRAESTLAALDPAAAAALPGVLRALVDVTGEGVVTSRAAPARLVAQSPEAHRLMDAFVAARLLVADTHADETSLRVAHDALLSGWPRAAALIAADREVLRTRHRVEAAARRWVQEDRDKDFLLPPGRPLAEAAELAQHRPESLDESSAAFVTASQAADQARQQEAAAHAQRELRLEAEAQQARADAATRVVRRTRAAVAVVSVLLVVAAGTAVFANAQRHEAQRQEREAQRQTAAAERNFRAALEGGTSLLDTVNGHLRDGGMTRDVARALLGTAGGTFGGLLQQEPGGAMPLPLQDTGSRLNASLATVQLAVCESAAARVRATEALALAEAAAAKAPSEARQLAVVQRLGTLGLALVADGDVPGAIAAYRRAEAVAAAQPGPSHGPLDVALQAVRRNLSLAKSSADDQDGALALVREDLAWQERQAALAPAELDPQAWQAFDLRRIAAILLERNDQAGADQALTREAEILHRLAAQQPGNLEWQRALSINIRQNARVAGMRGDGATEMQLSRQAAAMAASIAERDAGNAEWQRDLVIADVHLAALLARRGDFAGIKQALSPAMSGIKALSASASVPCQGIAAELHTMAGTALVLSGDQEASAAELAAALALRRNIAAANPTPALQLQVAAGEATLARSLQLAGKGAEAAQHARAGMEVAGRVAAADPGNMAANRNVADLAVLMGDGLHKAGDLDGAALAFESGRKAAERLAAANPQDPQWPAQEVISLLRIAEIRAAQSKPEEQRAALLAGIAMAEQLIARKQGSPSLQGDLVDAHVALGTAELGRKRPAEALAQFKQALETAKALAAEHPEDRRGRQSMATALTYVSLGYRSNQQPEEAETYAEQAKAAMQSWQTPARASP